MDLEDAKEIRTERFRHFTSPAAVEYQGRSKAVNIAEWVVAFLTSRGHQTNVLSPWRFVCDGELRTRAELLSIAEKENGQIGLESNVLLTRACICDEVANETASSETADKALALKMEWVVLVNRNTPPVPTLAERRRLDEEADALAGRMKEFLLSVQP